MAALRFCGVTPAPERIFPASLSLSSAIASSSRSTVTKLSPAFSAIFCAWSEMRARAGSSETCPTPAPGAWGRWAGRQREGERRGARPPARTVDQPGGEPFRVVEQHLEQMIGGELLVAFALGQALRGLHESARALGIF